MGVIAINGKQINKYEKGDYLLIIDRGGDDVYHDGATCNSEKVPVSVLIDYSGNDRYESNENSFGVGILGYGIWVDCDGNDVYNSGCGLGYCSWGVGMVMDRGAGNDNYKISTRGLACGSIVNDCGGNDKHTGVWYSQEAAAYYAVGAILDLGLFMAENGEFIFRKDKYAGQNRSWIRPDKKNPKSHGIGMASPKTVCQ